MTPAGTRGNPDRTIPFEDHSSDPVPPALDQETKGGGSSNGEVAFLEPGRPERHRAGEIDDDEELELPIGDRVADVGFGGAGGDVPVDSTHVVARFVWSRLSELGAMTGDQPLVIAEENPIQAAENLELERTKSALALDGADHVCGSSSSRTEMRGAGIVLSNSTTTSSTVTPSAMAS